MLAKKRIGGMYEKIAEHTACPDHGPGPGFLRQSNPTPNTGSNKTETPSETADTKTEGNVHIGIVTGSVSQSEDDRRAPSFPGPVR